MMGGIAFAMILGIGAFYAIGGLMILQFIPMGNGITMSGVYREVWTGAVKEQLSTAEKATFLDGIEDYSSYVSAVGDEMQVIHLVYMGVEPEVLINNTTYPIDEETLDQEDIAITLDKYQTTVTPITDDELFALSYKKIATVKKKHGSAIAKAKFKKAIHALAPSGNTDDMPVIVTTGDDDGNGRKKLQLADLITLKRKLDALEVADEGRRLVLCNDHVNDLLELDEKFRDQYYNTQTGQVYNKYGFEIYTYVGNPEYEPDTLTKLSYGAVSTDTSQKASVFFSLERAVKASGWTKMYYSQASTDPDNQSNRVNFRHYYVVLPTQEDARGAIVSDNVATE